MAETLLRYTFASEPGTQPLPRAGVYRGLVRGNLQAVIENAFPITVDMLGMDRFQSLLADFLDGGGPVTSLYRDIPGDVVSWAMATQHAYADLLHYEWLELVAARHPADLDDWSPPPDSHLHVNPTVQVGVYDRMVHLMGPDEPDPPRLDRPTAYLVWRRPNTDHVAFHRVGLLLARGLARAAVEPVSIESLAKRLARESGLDEAIVADRLGDAASAMKERDGLRWDPHQP